RFSRDWSSDVCSSDLKLKADFGYSFSESFTEEGGPNFSMTESFSFSESESNAGKGKWGLVAGIGAKINIHEWQASGIGMSLDVKIGRASCREREGNEE